MPWARRVVCAALLAAVFCSGRVYATADAKSDWAPAKPGYHFTFPADYGAHERSRNEWWYYTGNLRDASGRRFGFEETIFRYGVQHPIAHASHWDIDDLYFAHFALTDVDGRRFVSFDRTGRAALDAAGAHAGDELAWVGDWRIARLPSGDHTLTATAPDAMLRLRLVPLVHVAVHGQDGVSRKGSCATCASHYYSFTRMRASGMLRSGGRSFTVDGLAWNDHEWGSDELMPGVAGWDWFSIQLDGGTDIMLYRLRHADGTEVPQSSGTIVARDGSLSHLRMSDFQIAATGSWTSPHDGAVYPSGWLISVPRVGARLTVSPLLADQELTTTRSTRVSYWEGACAIAGTMGGKRVRGYGYTELTGYAPGGLGGLR
jgi:predicted secreted hydrolase